MAVAKSAGNDTLAIIRKLPRDLSSVAVANAYGVSVDYVERNRPKGNCRGRPVISFCDEPPIPIDNAHARHMAAGSAALLERMQSFHPDRFR